MEQVLFRLIKPILVALVAFGAVIWLTKDPTLAVAFALIPLLLGWLGIMESVAYGLAALALVIAVVVTILPAPVKQEITHLYNDVRGKLGVPGTTTSTP